MIEEKFTLFIYYYFFVKSSQNWTEPKMLKCINESLIWKSKTSPVTHFWKLKKYLQKTWFEIAYLGETCKKITKKYLKMLPLFVLKL
jgi:hypothetical protein